MVEHKLAWNISNSYAEQLLLSIQLRKPIYLLYLKPAAAKAATVGTAATVRNKPIILFI